MFLVGSLFLVALSLTYVVSSERAYRIGYLDALKDAEQVLEQEFKRIEDKTKQN